MNLYLVTYSFINAYLLLLIGVIYFVSLLDTQ